MTLVCGIFCVGNFSFLHPLSVVPLVASMGTVGSVPAVVKGSPRATIWQAATKYYRKVVPFFVFSLLAFAFLPSIKAYAWMLRGDYNTGPLLEALMSSRTVKTAESMFLGIPYNRHDYFATGLLPVRNELILFADLGGEQVELSIPQKVGRLEEMPLHRSPLHRRFAWQWLFLALEGNAVVGAAAAPAWFKNLLQRLCDRDQTAWAAVESSPAHSRLPELERIVVQLYQYDFAEPGSRQWWTRTSYGNVSWPGLGSTRFVQQCG